MKNPSQEKDLTLEERLTIILPHQLPMILTSLLRRGVSSVVNAETIISLRTKMVLLQMLRNKTQETKLIGRLIAIKEEVKEGTDLVARENRIRLSKRDLFSRTINVHADNAMARDLTKKLLPLLLDLTALISMMSCLLDSNSTIEDQLGLKTKDLITKTILPMDVPMLAMVDVVVMVSSLSLLDSLRSNQ